MPRVKDDYRGLSGAQKASTFMVALGPYDTTERLLYKSLPQERVERIMEEVLCPAGRTLWDKLGNAHAAMADSGEMMISSGGKDDERVY